MESSIDSLEKGSVEGKLMKLPAVSPATLAFRDLYVATKTTKENLSKVVVGCELCALSPLWLHS